LREPTPSQRHGMVIGRRQRRHPNFAGIQAAVSAGLGVSILPDVAILADHQILRVKDGFPSVGDTELALVAAPDASPATRRLADLLAEFCAPSVRER
jgi:DNA-binding transcriptional LysR family regulator